MQQNGLLSHPQDLDAPLRLAVQRKINSYRQQSEPNTFASAVRKECTNKRSPPEAFSAVAMVWTCFLTISLFHLDSILPGGESPHPLYV
jgi:hypothetical protein